MPFKPALGMSDFRQLREEGAGYVDKTDFIAQLLDESAQVVLFPRPRRFGKTINLSSLRYFLERRPEDLSHLFQDLAVWQHPGARAHFQRHPVLFLTFKDIRSDSWEGTFRGIRLLLQDLCLEHRDVITSGSVAPEEANELQQLLSGEATEEQCQMSLKRLSSLLSRACGEKVAILIDEYDTPIQAGFLRGFYDDVVRFFRNLFSAALKDNPALYRGALTTASPPRAPPSPALEIPVSRMATAVTNQPRASICITRVAAPTRGQR